MPRYRPVTSVVAEDLCDFPDEVRSEGSTHRSVSVASGGEEPSVKLRTKFAIILLVIALLLSGVTYGGLELFKQQTVEQNQANVNESTQLAADQIAGAIEERKDYIGYVASRPETADFSQSEETITGVVTNSRFFAAQIIAENGTVVDFRGQIDDSVRRETIGTDASDATYVQRARNQSAYLSEPEYVESRGQYLVIVSAPILENGRVKGVFAASIYLTDDTFFSGITPLDTDSQRITITADDAVLYESSTRFEQTTSAEATIDGTDWVISVARDRSRVNDRLLNLAFAQAIGLFVVLGSVLGLSAWEYRANLRQTERLLDAFEALRDGDYSYSLDMTTAEEWAQISDGFNAMATSLAEREEDIREREQRLEVLNRVLRHNLRNDLNVIRGYVEHVSKRTSDDRTPSMAAAALERADALLALSEKARSLESAMGEAERGMHPVDIAPDLRQTLEQLDAEHPAVGLDVSVPEQLYVWAIPAVNEAIAYICENAFVHNDDPEPSVTVQAERIDGETPRVEVSIADNGPGIPDHEREVLSSGRETPLEHGSGLGLWVAHWIVARIDGDIRLESNTNETVVTLVFEAADPPP